MRDMLKPAVAFRSGVQLGTFPTYVCMSAILHTAGGLSLHGPHRAIVLCNSVQLQCAASAHAISAHAESRLMQIKKDVHANQKQIRRLSRPYVAGYERRLIYLFDNV
jgi:hypothetical protein